MGTVIAQRPSRCVPPRQNERASSERALKKGGPGGTPLGFFLPISSQEMGTPARDRAGTHLAGSNLRWSKPDHLSTANPAPGPTRGHLFFT